MSAPVNHQPVTVSVNQGSAPIPRPVVAPLGVSGAPTVLQGQPQIDSSSEKAYVERFFLFIKDCIVWVFQKIFCCWKSAGSAPSPSVQTPVAIPPAPPAPIPSATPTTTQVPPPVAPRVSATLPPPRAPSPRPAPAPPAALSQPPTLSLPPRAPSPMPILSPKPIDPNKRYKDILSQIEKGDYENVLILKWFYECITDTIIRQSVFADIRQKIPHGKHRWFNPFPEEPGESIANKQPMLLLPSLKALLEDKINSV